MGVVLKVLLAVFSAQNFFYPSFIQPGPFLAGVRPLPRRVSRFFGKKHSPKIGTGGAPFTTQLSCQGSQDRPQGGSVGIGEEGIETHPKNLRRSEKLTVRKRPFAKLNFRPCGPSHIPAEQLELHRKFGL